MSFKDDWETLDTVSRIDYLAGDDKALFNSLLKDAYKQGYLDLEHYNKAKKKR